MNTELTILIVNYNSWDVLGICLKSLSLQSNQRFHVVVVDNNSTEDQSENLQKIYPNVRFLHNSDNLGFARANNEIIESLVDESWVFLLNPDTYMEVDCIEKLFNAIKRYPDCHCFSCKLLDYYDRDILDGLGDTYSISGKAWRSCKGKTNFDVGDIEVFAASGAAALYKVGDFRSAGMFDPDYFCYFEDVDLGFRLRLKGGFCIMVNDAVVFHMGSRSTGGQHSDFSVFYGHRNLVWTYVKNMPSYLFWLFLPIHLALNLFTLVYLALRGQGRIAVMAKIAALKGLPKFVRKRWVTQAGRTVSAVHILKILDKRIFTM